jgi:predicted nucleic acid-binding protein
MALLIDSSVFIAGEHGRLDLDALLARREDEGAAMAAITASELLHGVHRAKASVRPAREAFVERVLADFPVIPFDLIAARMHARLSAALASTGVVVGAHDLEIAATALAIGFAVATCDRRSFSRIPGLSTELW